MTALRTAQAVISVYDTWNIESILSYRAPDCLHHILPASLGIKPMANAEYAAYFRPQMAAFRKFNLTVHDTAHDEAAQKISMWVTSTAMTDIGPYTNEYMIVLSMNKEGTKVERLLEYVDSAHCVRFLGRLRAHMEEKR